MTIGTLAAHVDEHPAVVVKTWPRSFRTVTRARHLLSEHLDAWGLSHLADAAELVVSELVTNAVNHARSPRGHLIATRFERLESSVRIEVHDASERKPERQEASADAEFGRGLALVEALTSGQWGVSVREGPGKMVWAVCSDDEKIGTPQ
jgi:anti-sigma regulatory factor (Ser/Thr protein kinase)